MFAVFIAAKITSFLLLNWISISDNPHLILVLVSGVIGKVEFTVRHLSSATTSFPSSWSLSSGSPCLGNSRQVRNIRIRRSPICNSCYFSAHFCFKILALAKITSKYIIHSYQKLLHYVFFFVTLFNIYFVKVQLENLGRLIFK